MLTSHKLLQQFWYDERYDIAYVKIWYIDRGAPNDRSTVNGPDISLEPYYMEIRTSDGVKSVPYHRILLITYDDVVEFENRKILGLAYTLMGESQGQDIADQVKEQRIQKRKGHRNQPSAVDLGYFGAFFLVKVRNEVISSPREIFPQCERGFSGWICYRRSLWMPGCLNSLHWPDHLLS
jgi:uncharacterized protein (UPF0248 family)